MPSYMLGSRTATQAQRDLLVGLNATRHPEVLVDLRYAAHDGDGLDVWVCRAPSEIHVRRWAAAAELDLELLQAVDVEHAARPLPDRRGRP